MIDMIMFGWTFHQKKRLSSDAGFVEYKGFWFAVKLIARVFSWPFDWFHGATYSLWLIPFLEHTAESPWYSKCQPLIFPQGEDGFCGNGNILKNTDNIIGKKWTWSCWKDIEIIERGSLSYIWTNCARSVKAIAALWWWDFAQRKVKYNKPKSLSCRKTVLD